MPDSRTNNNNLQQMQQDAIRRVQEMQRRSRAQIHTAPPASSHPHGAADTKDPPQPAKENPSMEQKQPPAVAKTAGGLLEQLGIDPEQALLLLLLLVLAQEQADIKLLLAIAYLLL